jgi:catechol 2,3-dioxygenase-like lactoylglutathione lyase family enzyme
MIDLQLVNAGPDDAAQGAPTQNMDHFAIRIDPFDPPALRSHLESFGIDPGEVVQRYGAEGDGPSVYITDPDGNTIELKGPAGG